MTTELTHSETQAGQLQEWATAAQIRAQVNRIQEVMKEVMKADTHYGVIPGTKKPTLYKAGAEKILATFRLAAEPEVDDLSTADEYRYRVRVRLISPSGIALGSGVGEAGTNEEKYKWRRAICNEEYDATEEDRRRVKYSKWQGKVQTTKQVRTEPADLANTVLKMAKKRALIDATLTATAASDCFTQDIEDLPEGYDTEGRPEPERGPEPPQATQAGGHPQEAPAGAAKDGQKRVIRAKLEAKGIDEATFAKGFGAAIDALALAQVNQALDWIAEQ